MRNSKIIVISFYCTQLLILKTFFSGSPFCSKYALWQTAIWQLYVFIDLLMVVMNIINDFLKKKKKISYSLELKIVQVIFKPK